MLLPQSNPHGRRAVRRAVITRGQAVDLNGFRLLGERMLDLSPTGLLLACDAETAPGATVMVSFRAPGQDAPFIDAEAEVARVVQGFRQDDPGYCAGLRFTYLERSARDELLSRLCGFPPPIPRPRPRPEAVLTGPAVVVRPVLNLGDVAIPLTRRRYRAPRGVFCA